MKKLAGTLFVSITLLLIAQAGLQAATSPYIDPCNQEVCGSPPANEQVTVSYCYPTGSYDYSGYGGHPCLFGQTQMTCGDWWCMD